MQVVKHIIDLQTILDIRKKEGVKIGFVPTMGALHEGHLSLVEKAGQETDFVVVSIFVNPTQFNDKGDLDRYPRDLEKDVALLSLTPCQLIFAPEPEEIYPEPDTRQFNFGSLEEVMEGKFRPGHFNGVAQIVSKLFGYVQPDRAYFGEKDFQQLAIIHHMVKSMKLNVQIVDCPIVREASGLALSSRNERLSADEKKIAAGISKVLFESRNFVPGLTPAGLTVRVLSEINKIHGIRAEYFEIVRTDTLQPAENWLLPSIGCIAVFCGDVRLIDNIRYSVSQ